MSVAVWQSVILSVAVWQFLSVICILYDVRVFVCLVYMDLLCVCVCGICGYRLFLSPICAALWLGCSETLLTQGHHSPLFSFLNLLLFPTGRLKLSEGSNGSRMNPDPVSHWAF